MSSFDFGCAADLYRKRIHPRVLVGPDDLVRLRDRVKRGGGRRLMQALRNKVQPLAQAALEADDLPGLIADYNRSPDHLGPDIALGIHEMAMVAAIDSDAEMVEATRRVLLAAPDADPRSRDDHPCRRVTYLARPFALAYDLIAPHLTNRDRRACTGWLSDSSIPHIIASIPPQQYYRAAGANIPVYGTENAFPALMAVTGDPGVPSLNQERELLTSYLRASLHAAIGPDGYPVEDIGYGTSITDSLIMVSDILRRAGLYDAWSEYPRLKAYGGAILHFVQPWGRHMSNTGDFTDHWGNREYGLTRVAAETGDPTLLWLVGTLAHNSDHGTPKEEEDFGDEVLLRSGLRVSPTASCLILLDELQKPVRPRASTVPTQFRDRGRGLVSFRSGWKDDDTFVVFDSSQRSPACQGHDHACAGNFTLSALGEYFGIDCGRYCNEQQEHNVVLINGKSGVSHEGKWMAAPHAGILLDYAPGKFCDFAAADLALQSQCRWARRYLGLVKGQTGKGGPSGYVWTVEDVNHADDLAEFWWTLNTHPRNTIELHPTRATIHGCQVGAALDVHVALLPENQYPDPHTLRFAQDVNTCRATGYVGDPTTNADHYSTQGVHGSVMVRPRLIAKVKGWNGRFMSLMVPRAGNSRPPAVKQLKTHYDAFAVRVTFRDVEDTIIWAYHHGLLEAADIEAKGQWCVVRRSRKTRKVLRYALGEGTSLRVGGREMVIG